MFLEDTNNIATFDKGPTQRFATAEMERKKKETLERNKSGSKTKLVGHSRVKRTFNATHRGGLLMSMVSGQRLGGNQLEVSRKEKRSWQAVDRGWRQASRRRRGFLSDVMAPKRCVLFVEDMEQI